MIGQTKEIAPADKRIYALRDVTATVESIPLIVASILSKKLAEGIDGLVLDVKVGRGAFMKDEARARDLAHKLVRVGTRAGKKVVAILTRMDAPLGRSVGNASETREALEVLHGKGPADLVECTLVLGAEMLLLGGKAKDAAAATTLLREAIATGAAVRVMERMVEAQGGDPSVVTHPERLAIAKEMIEVRSPRGGFVTGVDALAIGLAGVAMGGRADARRSAGRSCGQHRGGSEARRRRPGRTGRCAALRSHEERRRPARRTHRRRLRIRRRAAGAAPAGRRPTDRLSRAAEARGPTRLRESEPRPMAARSGPAGAAASFYLSEPAPGQAATD